VVGFYCSFSDPIARAYETATLAPLRQYNSSRWEIQSAMCEWPSTKDPDEEPHIGWVFAGFTTFCQQTHIWGASARPFTIALLSALLAQNIATNPSEGSIWAIGRSIGRWPPRGAQRRSAEHLEVDV
jgi:hypothetical protein